MHGTTTIIDWLGSGIAADLPVAATLDALLSPGSTGYYYADDTGTLYVLNRDTVAWDTIGGVGVSGISQLTGDGTAGPGVGSQVLTFATVNANVGSFTNTNLTVNAKGLITAASTGSAAGSILTITKTSNYTVLTSDNGKHFNNIAAGGAVELDLPAAAAGLSFGFAVDATQYIQVNADGTDVIYVGANNSAAGGFVRSNVAAAYLVLVAHGTGKWKTMSLVGPWNIDS
jgi:hypothetical protein